MRLTIIALAVHGACRIIGMEYNRKRNMAMFNDALAEQKESSKAES